jgi:glycosyltransferase involved in cell wall biosynthesis
MPAVSVIILTKNRCELLKKALLSVELQKNVETEIIVVNDGSTDNTMEVLNGWHKPLVIINHLVSMGIVHSRQEAVTKASGEFIAFLDDDDEWIDENKLSDQVSWLVSDTANILIGTGMVLVDELGKKLGTVYNHANYAQETRSSTRCTQKQQLRCLRQSNNSYQGRVCTDGQNIPRKPK